MVVVLARRRVERPRAAAEDAQPVVGRPAVGRRVAPDVPVALRVVARGARLDEPRVLVGGVVRHEVEDHLHAARGAPRRSARRSRRACRTAGRRRCSRRRRSRSPPSATGRSARARARRRRATRGSRAARECPRRSPIAVAVGVLERARVDLVDDAALPPGHACRPSGQPIDRGTRGGAGPGRADANGSGALSTALFRESRSATSFIGPNGIGALEAPPCSLRCWSLGMTMRRGQVGVQETRVEKTTRQATLRWYRLPRTDVSLKIGGAEGARTPDPKTASLVLSQLSYSPTATLRLPSRGELVKHGRYLPRTSHPG